MLTTYLSVLAFVVSGRHSGIMIPSHYHEAVCRTLNHVLVPSSWLQPARETQEARHGQLTDRQDHSYAVIRISNQVSIELFPYPTHEWTMNDPPVVTMWRLFTGRSPPLPSQGTGRTFAVVCSRASYQ
jgi:hypothetical protein